MDKFKSRTVKYKDLSDKYKPDKVLMPDGTLAYPSDDTLIRVDEEGKPLDYSELVENNYAIVNEDGSYTAIEQLPEITVTFAPKKRFIEKVNDAITGFVNDKILMNKDNVRGKNMEKVYKTPTGKAVIDGNRDMNNLVAGSMAASVIFPILAPYSPEIAASYVGSEVVDKSVQATTDYNTWGEMVSEETGLHPILADMTNPGGFYGGAKINYAKSKDLFTKTIKGDAELGWNSIKDHWLFKGGATPTNITMAVTNRLLPFLNNSEKTPFRLLAYEAGKRSKGYPSIGLKDLFKNEASYVGTTVPGEGKNNLAFYLFRKDPTVQHTKWFKDEASKFKPADKKYLKPEKGEEYYQMSTVIPQGDYIDFESMDELLAYAPLNKPVIKDTGIIIKTPFGYKVMPREKGNLVGTIDDVGNHTVKVFVDDDGKVIHLQKDRFDFDTNYATNNATAENYPKFIRTSKQSDLMRSVGWPFWNQSWNKVSIGGKELQYFQKGGIIPLQYNVINPKKVDVETVDTKTIDITRDITPKTVDITVDPVVDYSAVQEELPQYNFEDFIYTDSSFDNAFDYVISKRPEASKYRTLLTKIAEQESGFNPLAKNPNAPAYGYFQFMEGDRWSNITQYAGVDINTFLHNPEIQINAAINLAQAFENSFSEEDIKRAEQLGYGLDSLIAGAWLAGPRGVKNFIWYNKNVDDKHWSPEGAGVSVKQIMDKYA